jgi:hypothetical protein
MKSLQIKNTIQAYTPERITFDGRDCLKVPAVILTEGVHIGSAGAAFYSLELLQQHVSLWNGVPVCVDHPDNHGEMTTINDPQEFDSRAVGRLFDARMDNRALKANLYLYVDRLQALGNGLYNDIAGGRPVEVSTGMNYATRTASGGVWANEEYDFSVLTMQPDHLALLTEAQGACSWRDGCGVRNKKGGSNMNDADGVTANVRTPSYDGVEDKPWADIDKSLSAYIAGYYKHTNAKKPDEPVTSASDMPAQMKRWIARKTLAGDANATTAAGLISYPVVNPMTNKLNKRALIAVKSRASAQGREDLVSKANALLKKEFNVENTATEKAKEKFKAFWNRLTNQRSETGSETSITETHRIMLAHMDSMDSQNDMFVLEELFANTVVYRKRPQPQAHIQYNEQYFVADYTISDDGEVELSNTREVRKRVKYEAVENETTDGEQTDGGETVENNEQKPEADGDGGAVETPPVEKTLAVDAHVCPHAEVKPAPEPVANAEEKPQTVDEYLANAPEEVREVLNEQRRVYNEKRIALVERIKNISSNKFTDEQLNAKPLGELENIAALIPNETPEVDGSNYLGNAGSGFASPDDGDDEPLEVPNLENVFKTDSEASA